MTTGGPVGVVILSWNAGALLVPAVRSVRESRGVEVELVVVDNGSTDPVTPGVLTGLEADGVAVVRLPTNTGYARGMNAGFAVSGGDPVMFMNCDAVLHPEALARAAATLAARPAVGSVGAHVVTLRHGGSWRFWEDSAAVAGFDGGVVGLDWTGHVVVPPDRGEHARECFKANGACPVVRRAVIDDLVATYGVGPFDPLFDTYGEDVDFAWKAWALGWRTLYCRDVRAGHVRSYASPLEKPDKRGRLRVNLVAERYLNALRHLSAPRAAAQVLGSLRDDVVMIAGQLCRGDREVVSDVAAAWRRVARALPALGVYRQRHREWRRVDVAALRSGP